MTRSVSYLTGDMTSKILVLAVSAVFASLIVIQAYQLWQASRPASTAPLAAPAPALTQVKPVTNVRQLAASHLFGDTEVITPQYTEIKEDKSLKLTLRGIVANRGGNTSLAIIESGPNNEETFAVGENVFNKGTLDHVADDHVILNRGNGQLARLQLPDQNVDETISEEFLPLAQPETYQEPAIDASTVVEQPDPVDPGNVAEQVIEPEIELELPEMPATEEIENAELPADEPQEPQPDADRLP